MTTTLFTSRYYSILLFLAASLLLFTAACNREIEEYPLTYGYDYFPFEEGYWRTYEVDSFLYSRFFSQGIDTVKAEMREVFGEPFIDNEGRSALTILRYVRYDNTPWSQITPKVWYAVKDSQKCERVEGDLRFINLVFPIQENRSWNGNAYIDLDQTNYNMYKNWNYVYGAPNTAYSYNLTDGSTRNFSETVRVGQIDEENLIDKKYSYEIYAQNAGLVYRETWILNFGDQTNLDPSIPWPQRAQIGFLVTYKLKDYKH